MQRFVKISACLLLVFYGCISPLTPEKLYGKWRYIKVENPDSNPPDSVRNADLKQQAPYIQFSQNNRLLIMWGGKVLSHGTFTTEGQNIQYTETLSDGSTRKFPFWVVKLTDKEIIFETKEKDKSVVTAGKF